jgi:hypothetical protein
MTDLVIIKAQVTTLDRANPQDEAIAIRDGRFLAASAEQESRAAVPAPVAYRDRQGGRHARDRRTGRSPVHGRSARYPGARDGRL